MADPIITRQELERLVRLCQLGEDDRLVAFAKGIAQREETTFFAVLASATSVEDRDKGLAHYVAEYGNLRKSGEAHIWLDSEHQGGIFFSGLTSHQTFSNDF